jgi:CheY-like chemotaxis protein
VHENCKESALTMRKRKVLIVEDDPDLRRLYAIGLNQRGYQVRLAANGAEALVRLEEEKPDIILLDLLMPVMSGWEVLERLNPHDRDCIPVVVISGQTPAADQPAHECIAGWLSKPVALDELASSIERALPAIRRRRPDLRSSIA